METWPIGVFTSVDAGLGVDLDVARELGIPTVQIHAPHPGNRTQATADAIAGRLSDHGLTVTAVFGGFDGESYADIPAVEKTIGLVPESTRESRLAEMKEISDFANMLGCSVIALHIGCVPHDTSSPVYQGVLAATQELCKYATQYGQAVHLETGQETAPGLLQFLNAADCDNLFVNFDPANMIMYGAGDPIEALELLGDRVRSVHLKDATWSANPGKEFGDEVPLGMGDVGIEKYLRTLKILGYTGPLTIEREIATEPARQKSEIGGAVDLINKLKSEIL